MAAMMDDSLYSRVGFIRFLLDSEHGIIKTDSEVWAAINEDAGRDFTRSVEMVDTLSTDKEAFNRFAETFTTHQKVVVVSYGSSTIANDVAMLAIGLATGFVLYWIWSQ